MPHKNNVINYKDSMHRPTCEEGLVLLFSSDFQHEENQCSPDPVNCNKRMSQAIIRNAKHIDPLSHSKQYKNSVLRASLDTKVAWSKSRWQLVIHSTLGCCVSVGRSHEFSSQDAFVIWELFLV